MIPILQTGLPTGTGGIFQTQVVTPIAAGARFIPTVGVYYVLAVGADVRLQILDGNGVWNNITPAGTIPDGVLIMDGNSIGFVNNGVGIENVTTLQIG